MRPYSGNDKNYVPKHEVNVQGQITEISAFGSISFTLVPGEHCGYLHIHDGVTPGGVGLVQCFPNPNPGGPIPILPPVMPPPDGLLPDGQTSVTINHNYNTYPIVQVIDSSSGEIESVTITHNDANSFTVSVDTASHPDYIIVYRF